MFFIKNTSAFLYLKLAKKTLQDDLSSLPSRQPDLCSLRCATFLGLSSFLAIAKQRRDSLSSSRVFRPCLQKLEFPRTLKTCPEEQSSSCTSAFVFVVLGNRPRLFAPLPQFSPVIAPGTAELRQSRPPRDELKAYAPRVCSFSPLLRTSLSERYGVHPSVCPPSPSACPPDSRAH